MSAHIIEIIIFLMLFAAFLAWHIGSDRRWKMYQKNMHHIIKEHEEE